MLYQYSRAPYMSQQIADAAGACIMLVIWLQLTRMLDHFVNFYGPAIAIVA